MLPSVHLTQNGFFWYINNDEHSKTLYVVQNNWKHFINPIYIYIFFMWFAGCQQLAIHWHLRVIWTPVALKNSIRPCTMLNKPSGKWKVTWNNSNSVMLSWLLETEKYLHIGKVICLYWKYSFICLEWESVMYIAKYSMIWELRIHISVNSLIV